MKVVFLLALACGATISLAPKEWRTIVPLRSTRADVEKLLGPHKKYGGSLSDYETTDERVTVMYASGPPCAPNGFQIWNVPRDTVIGITLQPKRELRFVDLKLDEAKYKKTDNEGHGPPYFYYTDEKAGLQYEVIQGRVMSISYFPAAKDDHLRCSP
ncbi:MAG TPA: hypothetical protein VFX97_15565 [Pyrinomonadaceae bacterium]|nr:hypothetical protein [Pyrinomonadaceae bacterium]